MPQPEENSLSQRFKYALKSTLPASLITSKETSLTKRLGQAIKSQFARVNPDGKSSALREIEIENDYVDVFNKSPKTATDK